MTATKEAVLRIAMEHVHEFPALQRAHLRMAAPWMCSCLAGHVVLHSNIDASLSTHLTQADTCTAPNTRASHNTHENDVRSLTLVSLAVLLPLKASCQTTYRACPCGNARAANARSKPAGSGVGGTG